MRITQRRQHDCERIARDVAEYLERGGTVQVIEPGRCGSRADDSSFLFGFERRGGAVELRTVVLTETLPEVGDADAEHDVDTLVDLVLELPD